jgi:hypothetical protein
MLDSSWNSSVLRTNGLQVYYDAARSHASLNGRTPLTFVDQEVVAPADPNHVQWVSHCPGPR